MRAWITARLVLPPCDPMAKLRYVFEHIENKIIDDQWTEFVSRFGRREN